MRIGLFGGLSIEHDGRPITVTGAMQQAVLFRLAADAGTSVSYRAIAEDVWAVAPENERAALQSIVSRLRSQLPPGTIESTVGGYRLVISRQDVDALAFVDLVAAASTVGGDERARLASDALALWAGEPWTPSDDFDWFEKDLRRDRATALEFGGVASPHRAAAVIPMPLTTLIGRERELDSIAEQLAASRLVTIVGVGGAGKTRLAVETAAAIPGSVLVELAPVGAGEILTAILAATGRELRTTEGAAIVSLRDRVHEALVGRPVLLVLDNCEHIIDDVARAAESLLGSLPLLQILATSREPLAIAGEAFVAVGPLPHPREDGLATASAYELRSFDAVELFAQRAVAARGVALDDDELRVAARICVRLDGLPLALELAAAKLRTMTPAEILDGLEDRFALLTGGYRTALPRHRTLRAMIDWSWSLLTDQEQFALTRIAVFPAGISTADAAQVAKAVGGLPASVFDSLVDRSLLERRRGRFRALETIREYGIERLVERGELAAALEAQATVMADRAAEFDRMLRRERILDAISWFDAEADNIAAALRYATSSELADLAVRLAEACTWYWIIRGQEEDATTWFIAVSPLAAQVDTDAGRMLRLIAPIVALVDPNGDHSGRGEGRDQPDGAAMIATIQGMVGELPEVGVGGHELMQLIPPLVHAFLESGTDQASMMLLMRPPLGEDLGLDPWPTAFLHFIRAVMAHNRGDVEALGAESAMAVEQFTRLGDIWGLGFSQQTRAEWLVLEGHLAEAFTLAEESTRNFRQITQAWDLANQQALAISILVRQGRFAEARERVNTLLHDAEHTTNARAQAEAQVAALRSVVSMGDLDMAAELLERLDVAMLDWPRMPPQTAAWVETSRSALELTKGNRDAAESAMRSAVDAALISHDFPVIGAVALDLGLLALDRGDIREALRAVDLASAVMGVTDATAPQVVTIEKAAAEAGIGRAGAEAPTRPAALEILAQLTKP